MKWFRFYHEALDDPKVQLLSDRRYRQWVNLLCLANQGTPRGSLPDLAGVAFRLRISPDEAVDMLDEFVRTGLIDPDEAGLHHPHNWNGRQRASDDVAARVSEHRERVASSNGSNVPVTLHETLPKRSSRARSEAEAEADTDTDTELLAAATRATPEIELSADELEIVGILHCAPGLSPALDDAIAIHLREVLSCRDGPALSALALRSEAMKFRDYWRDKRTGQRGRWRGWQNAMTNWFLRANEISRTDNTSTDLTDAAERKRHRDKHVTKYGIEATT